MSSSVSVKLAAIQAQLEQLPADSFRYRLVRSHMDYLLGAEGHAVANFRDCLNSAAEPVLADRSLLNDVAEAAFCMREFHSFESFLTSTNRVAIRVVSGRDDEPRNASAVLCALDRDNSLTFHFSDDLTDHPDAAVPLKHWVQSLPLLVNFVRRNAIATARAWLSLGDTGSMPGLAFCDFRNDYHLVPDPIFLQTAAYADAKAIFSTQSTPWHSREPIAFWRGQTTGWFNAQGDQVRSWEELPRVQLCRIARSAAGEGLVDASLTGLAQIASEPERQAIKREGLLKEHVPWSEFQRYKYQIDIDGNSSAWPGLFIKLCSGSPILKVASGRGFQQWYYDRLEPWQNFVPVEADMSDLLDKVLWLRQHDEVAWEIGQRARQLALSMSERAEILRAEAPIKKAFRYDSEDSFYGSNNLEHDATPGAVLSTGMARHAEKEQSSCGGSRMMRGEFDNLGEEAIELDAFSSRVSSLTANGLPVKLYLGAGETPKIGFINIDRSKFEPVRDFFLQYPDDYILFRFAERSWPIPDNSVDYIYHEDMFEHLPQKNQFLLLAEALRVLKPGAIHRINTPCLVQAMRAHSDFSQGLAGVYVYEWERWGHVALVSRASLQEMALLVGYRYVYFTAKSEGMSPYAIPDSRPHGDRDQVTGNVFADLLK